MNGGATLKHIEEGWRYLVPTGRSGDAVVSQFEIGRPEIMAQIMSYSGPLVPEGIYCHLAVGDQMMMSNTPWERRTAQKVLQESFGDVLIIGLGLGCVVRELLRVRDSALTSVTVLEKSAGVITLVADHCAHPKVRIIEGDAFTYKPDQQFDCIWIDIWPEATERFTGERRSLAARYRKFKRPGGWLKTWTLQTWNR